MSSILAAIEAPWPRKHRQWEYRSLELKEPVTKDLNIMGEEGWELVGTTPTTSPTWHLFYFKRPVLPQ